MTKHASTDVAQPELDVNPQPTQDAVLFGNDGYVSDHRPRVSTRHTQAEWLAEALPIQAEYDKGNAVSHENVMSLFLDAIDVIEGFVPPAARGKKHDGD